MNRPKFITLFIDMTDELSLLDDARAGQLIKALLRYADSAEKPDFSDDTALCVMFSILKKQIDRDFEKYEESRERRTASAKKAAAARYRKDTADCAAHASACDPCHNKDNNNNNNNDNDNDNDNNNDGDNARGADLGQAGLTGEIVEAGEVIDHLNQKAGTRFRPTTAVTRRCIAALLSQGYTVQDMKRVIDVKCDEWLNTGYAKYLRPETLFGERFESYLNTPLPKPALSAADPPEHAASKSGQPRPLPKSRLHPWQNSSQDEFLRSVMKLEEEYEVPGFG